MAKDSFTIKEMSDSESPDCMPRNSTEPFSQMLRVTDSDETLSEDGYNLNCSSSPLKDQDVVDLTTLSNSLNEFSSTKDGSENTSLIEISDSVHSSLTLNCSTMNSQPDQIHASAQARLDDFFDNIPDAVPNFNLKRSDEMNDSQLSKHTNNESCHDIYIDETKSSNNCSESIQTESQENSPSIKNWNVNISAKIKIKVHVSEQDESNGSSSNSEKETKRPTFSKKNSKTCNQEMSQEKLFLDDGMIEILTEIYGDSWKTDAILDMCQPTIRDDIKAHQQKKSEKSKDLQQKKNVSKVSFLKSLDEKTSQDMCSAEALQYRTNYNTTKDALMLHLYELYNRNIFGNKLDVPCSWNKKLTCTAGRCVNIKRNGERCCRIELSDKVVTNAERMRCTLIHEMCHAAAWIINAESGHGKHWKMWTQRAARVFPDLPPITVCHQYEIEYKYTYQCVLCKASYNAHSRSKKIENIRCAYCYGNIKLFLNKKNKNGDIIATPAKKATGFAAFVKETYKEVRKNENNHAATMKILSEKFAALNTDAKN